MVPQLTLRVPLRRRHYLHGLSLCLELHVEKHLALTGLSHLRLLKHFFSTPLHRCLRGEHSVHFFAAEERQLPLVVEVILHSSLLYTLLCWYPHCLTFQEE